MDNSAGPRQKDRAYRKRLYQAVSRFVPDRFVSQFINACGYKLANTAMIPERCKPTLGTETSRTPPGTLRWRRIGSKASGKISGTESQEQERRKDLGARANLDTGDELARIPPVFIQVGNAFRDIGTFRRAHQFVLLS